MNGRAVWAACWAAFFYSVVAAPATEPGIGQVLDSYRGIPVYDNGPVLARSHGRHFHPNGVYFGKKWQCVEYVKRFYYLALDHVMPDGMGHAKEFFDPAVPHGAVNPRRGLRQFANGGSEWPQPDDLLVYTEGTFGHVAIVTAVSAYYVTVIQQNVEGRVRMLIPVETTEGGVRIGRGAAAPAGWLRK
jgi:hypothetical protein